MVPPAGNGKASLTGRAPVRLTSAMSFIHWAQRLDGRVPRRLLAGAANFLGKLRAGDRRRFAVDERGRWINRQPEATFVTPELFTAHFAQVRASVLEYWCQYYTPGEGDVVVDVGAGIGEDAAVFSRLVGPNGRVIAIEAHPGTFDCLRETVKRSGLANVTLVHCAVADREGRVTIEDSAQHLGNALVAKAGGGGIEVAVRTLDDLAGELGIARIDLLKMNIEGAEGPAIKGMARCAAMTRHAAISCHDFVADAGGRDDWFRTRATVQTALEGFGFTVRRRADAAHPWLRDTLYGERPAGAVNEPNPR